MALIENITDLQFHPVTSDRWNDLQSFFQKHGNPNYCWCMRWRLRSTEFKQLNAAQRCKKLEALVRNKVPIGILGYFQDAPIGWCSIAPRETYALLEHSRILKRIDEQPVWSLVCFFVARSFRRQNLSAKLLQAAANYAISQGANIIEGYPVEPDQSYRFMGAPKAFEQAGFRKVATAENGRQILRFEAKNGIKIYL